MSTNVTPRSRRNSEVRYVSPSPRHEEDPSTSLKNRLRQSCSKDGLINDANSSPENLRKSMPVLGTKPEKSGGHRGSCTDLEPGFTLKMPNTVNKD